MARQPASSGMIGQEIGRQISAKAMGFPKSEILTLTIGDKKSEHFLYRVVGVANALKPYKSRQKNDDGELMTGFGLIGNFEATSVNGEVMKGSVLYLPGYVQDMAVGALSMPETAAIRVAFDVYARFDEASATSYVFNVRDLINAGAESVEEVKAEIAALPMPGAKLALPSE